MSYCLKALIGKSHPLDTLPKTSSLEHRVNLAQDLTMILLTDELFDDLAERFPSDVEDNYKEFSFLSDSVMQWALQLSKTTPVAYVEAEFFGGTGGQSCIAWDEGVIRLGPLSGEIGPINEALRFLGAEPKSARDEFQAVGLMRARDHEGWIKVSDE